jgi:hypothetical protein
MEEALKFIIINEPLVDRFLLINGELPKIVAFIFD